MRRRTPQFPGKESRKDPEWGCPLRAANGDWRRRERSVKLPMRHNERPRAMMSRLVLRLLLVSGPSSYALGAVAAALAAGVQLAFRDFFLHVPFLLFFPATIVAAFLGGWRAGLTCAAIAAPVATYFFLGTSASFAIGMEDWLRLLIFVLICLLIVALLWLLQTVSQQLFAERELVRLLAREGHHRIGNSLQLIAATLQLQGKASASADVKRALDSARNRVSAIARVHRRLHESNPAATLRIGPYVDDLCKDIEAQAGEGTAVNVRCADFELPVDTAIKLGLILSELLLNAIKHGGATQSVEVDCRRAADGEFALRISDGGAGFPTGFDPAASRGLGMMLITSLAQEMGGRVAFQREHGRTIVEIAVPSPWANT
jgi:two-component sensor histidine kinase